MPRGKKAAAAKAPSSNLVRRHRESGEISARKRGRPHPDFELGYLDEAGEFQAGNPPKRRRRRRRGFRGGAAAAPAATGAVARKAKLSGGLSEIEQIIRREVESRLAVARDAAIKAISSALRG